MSMSTPNSSLSVGECLSWDLSLFNNYTDEDEDGEILTTLVRKSYINHIERSLIKNYEHWLDSNRDSNDLNCSKEDISKCAKLLEHKALRACMVTRYYQQATVKIMKEIKKSTEEGSLYSPFVENLFNKEIKKQCEKGTQTSISLTNCRVESPKQSEDTFLMPLKKKTIDNTQDNSDLIIPNSSTKDKSDIDKEKNDLEDLIYILTESPNFSEKNDSDKESSPKKVKYKKSIEGINVDNASKSNLTDSGYVDERPNRRNLDERIQKFAAMFGIGEYNSNTEETDPNDSLNSANEDVSSAYDNDSIISENNTPSKLALDWKSEYGAQNCHLKSKLARLNPIKKAKVQKTFNTFFGDDEPMDLEISLTEAALRRKRTANLVVRVLTPYYVEGRIASRNVFKSMAKKITDEILQVTDIAGLEEVTAKVNACFENRRCIITEQDVIECINKSAICLLRIP